jgi:hypothetical protein
MRSRISSLRSHRRLNLVQEFCGRVDGEVAIEKVFTIAGDNSIQLIERDAGELDAIFKVFQSKVERSFNGCIPLLYPSP